MIIADGLKGTDEVDVPVEGGEYVKTAKLPGGDGCRILSFPSPFKCHEEAGVGGAMKNVGMGCGSGAGKREMHSDGRPLTDREKCVGCGACAKICAHKGPKLRDGKMEIDWSTCVGCGRCMAVCRWEPFIRPTNTLPVSWAAKLPSTPRRSWPDGPASTSAWCRM